jgi:hypothetical protein
LLMSWMLNVSDRTSGPVLIRGNEDLQKAV